MGFGALVVTACGPIIKIILLSSMGVVMTRNGTLGQQGKLALGNLTKNLFMPCLVFTQFTRSVSLAMLADAWIIPALAVGWVLLGFVLAVILEWVLPSGSRELRRVVLASCAVGNVGNMPLVMIASMCEDANGPLHAIPECTTKGLGCVMVGMWVGTVAQWSIGVVLLSPPPSLRVLAHSSSAPTAAPDNSAAVEMEPVASMGEGAEEGEREKEEGGEGREGDVEEAPADNHKGRKARQERSALLQPPLQHDQHGRGCGWYARRLVNLPLITVAAGMLVGLVPPLKEALLREDSLLFVPFRCLETIGGAFIPCIMLLLGSNLASGPKPVQLRAVVAVCGVRLVLLPLLSCATVYQLRSLGWMTQDPLVGLVTVLMGAAPTAINLNTIATLQGYGCDHVAALLFYQYLLAAVFMTLALILALRIVFPTN